MKVYILTDNSASGYFYAEHGLSYFIEYDINILFDTGHSDIFLRNALKFGIDINSVDKIVLSHGHWDHGNGLKFINDKPMICHPGAFIKRFHKNDSENIGLNLNFKELNEKFELSTSEKPVYLSDNIVFLGQIPRLNHFESKVTSFVDSNQKEDFVPDDSALAIILKNELIIISGCAHSGICNIIEYSKKITGISKIKAVIGGFHLKYNDFQTQETIKYLKNQDIKELLPSHCTQLPALASFYNEFKINHVKTGLVFEY